MGATLAKIYVVLSGAILVVVGIAGFFRHEARWNAVERRMEMHLRSTRQQAVGVRAAGLRIMLEEDETIWTESSHKYNAEEIPGMAARTGFRCDGQWIDEEWPFAQNLLIAE